MHHVDKDYHAEEAEDDRGNRRQALDRQADAACELRIPGVFSEVYTCAYRQRYGYSHRQEQHVERVKELRADAASGEHVA